MSKTAKIEQAILIKPPKIETLGLLIEGTAPLVIERFSKKAELMGKMAEGKSAKSKKERSARDYDREAEEARYRSDAGWEGMNASSFRSGCISACRLVGFKMTLAKLSLFIQPDGFDVNDGLPLVHVYGTSNTFTAHTRNQTGVVDIRSRPMYREWASLLRVSFDADQFTASDIVNLIHRVGTQVGIGAGRPDSKSSSGCGWGLFRVVPHEEEEKVRVKFGIL